ADALPPGGRLLLERSTARRADALPPGGRLSLAPVLRAAQQLPLTPRTRVRMVATGLVTLNRALRNPDAGSFIDFFRERHLLRGIRVLSAALEGIQLRIDRLESLNPRTPAQARQID